MKSIVIFFLFVPISIWACSKDNSRVDPVLENTHVESLLPSHLKSTYQMVWNDEFDRTTVNLSKWNFRGEGTVRNYGYGLPVKDAATTINVSRKGKYRVWVRTRNWVAPWNVAEAPGLFQLSINKKLLNNTFGTDVKEWHWQDGGTVSLNAGAVEIALQDLTGFNGRCDAIYLTTNTKILPPDGGTELLAFRRDKSGLPKQVVQVLTASGRNVTEANNLFPILALEIASNPNLTQNPGY